MALLDPSTLATQLSAVFEQHVQLSLIKPPSIVKPNYINWPKQGLQHKLYVSHLSARYVYSEASQITAARRLGYEPETIKANQHPLFDTWQMNNLSTSPCKSPFGATKERSAQFQGSPSRESMLSPKAVLPAKPFQDPRRAKKLLFS